MKCLTVCLFAAMFLLCLEQLRSQDITGVWSGYFITNKAVFKSTGYTDTFQFGIRIQTGKKGKLTATTLTHQGSFYAEATAKLSFNSKKNIITITENSITRVSPGTNIATPCYMICKLNYQANENGEELTGSFVSRSTQKSRIDCGGGIVYLKKIATD